MADKSIRNRLSTLYDIIEVFSNRAKRKHATSQGEHNRIRVHDTDDIIEKVCTKKSRHESKEDKEDRQSKGDQREVQEKTRRKQDDGLREEQEDEEDEEEDEADDTNEDVDENEDKGQADEEETKEERKPTGKNVKKEEKRVERDEECDKKRDEKRDAKRDKERDKKRDEERDEKRDEDRDRARDKERDDAKDHDRLEQWQFEQDMIAEKILLAKEAQDGPPTDDYDVRKKRPKKAKYQEEKGKRNDRRRHKKRDRERDKKRDMKRDEARDEERDPKRDEDRDRERDRERDEAKSEDRLEQWQFEQDMNTERILLAKEAKLNQNDEVSYVYQLQYAGDRRIYIGETARHPKKRFEEHYKSEEYDKFHMFMKDADKSMWTLTILHTLYNVTQKERLTIESYEMNKHNPSLLWNSAFVLKGGIRRQESWNYNRRVQNKVQRSRFHVTASRTIDECKSLAHAIHALELSNPTLYDANVFYYLSCTARYQCQGEKYSKCYKTYEPTLSTTPQIDAEKWISVEIPKAKKRIESSAHSVLERSMSDGKRIAKQIKK